MNQSDSDGETPLHQSIYEGLFCSFLTLPVSTKRIKFLPNVSTGYKKAIELLVEKGANVNAVENDKKMTPLHYIALYDPSSQNKDWTEDDSLSNVLRL